MLTQLLGRLKLRIILQSEFRFNLKSCKHDDVIKWKHFPRYWPVGRGIHRSPVNSGHEGQCRALMFSLICARINSWVNNREAGHLRCHRAHYDVTVMNPGALLVHWSTNDFTQITSFTQICSVETSKRFRLRKYLSLVKEILCHCCSWKIELYRLYLKVLNPLSWSNADLLQIRHLGTNFSEIRIRIPTFSFMKMYLKMSLANWWPFFQAYMR